MIKLRVIILAAMLLAIFGCADEKAAGDKAAADVKNAAAAEKDPAAKKASSKGKGKGKGAKTPVEDEPAPALAVPEDYRYEARGRRDPFVNPIPKPVAPPPEIPTVRPDGLPGVLVAEAKINGIVVSKEPGMNKVVIGAPNKKTFFASLGDTLFDAVIKEIRANEVVFTMISPSTKQPVNRETTVKTGASAGTSAGDKK